MKGCEAASTLSPSCERSRFGCCLDGATPAEGPAYLGCDWESSGEICEETTYGCCPDGVTAADGENYKGCTKDKVRQTLHAICV